MKTILGLLLVWSASAGAAEQVCRLDALDLATNRGQSVMVGGGVQNFLASRSRSVSDIGGYWDARIAVGTRTVFGVEGAYSGAAQDLHVPGFVQDQTLTRNGLEAGARINLPFQGCRWQFAPFLFGGPGWQRYGFTDSHLPSTNARAHIANSDNSFTVPVGGGLNFTYGYLMVDYRFTYRMAFGDGLLKGMNPDAGLQSWSVGVLLGFQH
jgi:hypothetical protein